MSKCIRCGNNKGGYEFSEGGYVCEECIGFYFTCPDCGTIYPRDTGDAGNGFCEDCAVKH